MHMLYMIAIIRTAKGERERAKEKEKEKEKEKRERRRRSSEESGERNYYRDFFAEFQLNALQLTTAALFGCHNSFP